MPVKSRSLKRGTTASKKSAAATTTTASKSQSSTATAPSTPRATAPTNVPLLSVVFDKGSVLTPQQALAAAHWLRQFLGLVIGLVFGALRLTGFPPIVTFCFIAFTAPFSFLNALHELDLEEINAVGTIQTEGFFPAVALFFLSWIISYTIFFPAST